MDSFDSGWQTASPAAFEQQLARNRQEFYSPPEHWSFCAREIANNRNAVRPPDGRQSGNRIERMVDIGCGVGGLYAVANTLGIKYIGYDYAPAAIDVAANYWGPNLFFIKRYEDLTPDDINDDDIIVANALCDVLPNGDECFEHLLSLNAKQLLILRVRLSYGEPSSYEEYVAYDEIRTYAYKHNSTVLSELVQKYGYDMFMNYHIASEDIVNIGLTK